MVLTMFSSLCRSRAVETTGLTAGLQPRTRPAGFICACCYSYVSARCPDCDIAIDCESASGARQHFPWRDAAGGKAAGKRAALALHAGHFEPAAVALQRVLDDGEAETRAAELSRSAGIDAVETLGQPRQVLGRDPDAGVAKLDARAALVDPPAHVDAAVGGRVFGCVGEQVREDRMQLGLRA